MDLETLTGAGGTITLGGRTFLLSPLTLQDVGFVRTWLREQAPDPFATVSKALKELRPQGPPPVAPAPPKPEKQMTGEEAVAWAQQKADYAARKAEWDQAWADFEGTKKFLLLEALNDTKAGTVISGPAAENRLNTIEGVSLMLWLSIRKQHPDVVSREQVQALLENEDLAAVQRRLDAVNGAQLDDVDQKENPFPNRPAAPPATT
jgi:hypothetical protein